MCKRRRGQVPQVPSILNGYLFWGVLQNSYDGNFETPQTRSFRLFALLTSSTGVTRSVLGGVKALGPNHNGNMFDFQMPQHIHFFSGVIIELKMMVSGLDHLLGRVKTSDLVQSGRDTFLDVVGGLTRAHG